MTSARDVALSMADVLRLSAFPARVVSHDLRAGYVIVTAETTDGVTFHRSVRCGYISTQMQAGTPVFVGYDRRRELAIVDIDFDAQVEAGLNPASNNAADLYYYGYVTQDSIQTLLCHSLSDDSLEVVVRPWFYVKDGVWYEKREERKNLSSYLPSANTHRLVAVWIASDNTIEITTSTEQNLRDALDLTDVQECQDSASFKAEPVRFWRMYGGQDGIKESDAWRDGRQIINVHDRGNLPLFGAGFLVELASDVAVAGVHRHLILAAQTGTADNCIEVTGLSVGDEVILRADAGDTITIKHNDAGATDKLILYNAADIALSGNKTLKLMKIASGLVVQYVDEKGSTGAPDDATYITQTHHADLSAEQAMADLATGLVKNTTATGVQSIAAAGTDYTSPTGTEGLSNKTITLSSMIATALSLLIGGFKAIFTHANSADRTYTLPNASGTIALTSDIPAAGINQLTGDVAAGPGSGSQAATLATVNSAPGSFTNASLTVNDKGLVTAASNGTAPVTNVTGTSPIASSGGATPNISLGDITTKLIFDEWSETGTPSADTDWLYVADDNGYTFPRVIDSNATILQLFRERMLVAKNVTGSSIAAGSVVQVNSASGGSPAFSKVSRSSGPVDAFLIGITKETAANNALARIQIAGVCTPFDTSGYSVGDNLYLSGTAGTLTNSASLVFPAYHVKVATVLTSSVNGSILINPTYDLFLIPLDFKIGDGSSDARLYMYGGANFGIIKSPSTLTSNRTWTMPDNSGTVLTDASASAALNDFSGGITVNSSNADSDTNIRGDTDVNAFYLDASADAVAIGTSAPSSSAKFEVSSTSKGAIPAPSMTAAQRDAIASPVEGLIVYVNDTDEHWFYDGQRWRAVGSVGWTPYAYPVIFDMLSAYGTALALAANGGSLAIPMNVPSHMLLQAVEIVNTDTSLNRTWAWDLYRQYLNNGNSGENTLTRVVASNGSENFTATAISVRTLAATSAPVYLAPGVYWLVIQCRHATQNFGLGRSATSTNFAPNTTQTKTTTNPNGSTLDFVAATWSKRADVVAARLDGRVFGQTTAF